MQEAERRRVGKQHLESMVKSFRPFGEVEPVERRVHGVGLPHEASFPAPCSGEGHRPQVRWLRARARPLWYN